MRPRLFPALPIVMISIFAAASSMRPAFSIDLKAVGSHVIVSVTGFMNHLTGAASSSSD